VRVNTFEGGLRGFTGLLVILGLGGTCKTYASAIALEELAITASAGAHPSHPECKETVCAIG